MNVDGHMDAAKRIKEVRSKLKRQKVIKDRERQRPICVKKSGFILSGTFPVACFGLIKGGANWSIFTSIYDLISQ